MSASSSRDDRAAIADVFQQDVFRPDGSAPASELSILGNGFFIVREADTNEYFATQSGHFNLNAEGYLVTDAGARVQGRVDGSFCKVGDIRIGGGDMASISGSRSSMLCYSIDSWGKIRVYLADGTCFLRGQVMLQNFRDPEALINEGDDLYSNLSAAGPLPALAAPGTTGLGAIRAGIPQICQDELATWTN